ncbi:ATP-dependent DNA helicase, partial [Trichonephila clavata]
MSEDILHRMRRINANPNIQFTSNICSEALILIEDVRLTIANKSLTELGMIAPNRYSNDIFDCDIQRECPSMLMNYKHLFELSAEIGIPAIIAAAWAITKVVASETPEGPFAQKSCPWQNKDYYDYVFSCPVMVVLL